MNQRYGQEESKFFGGKEGFHISFLVGKKNKKKWENEGLKTLTPSPLVVAIDRLFTLFFILCCCITLHNCCPFFLSLVPLTLEEKTFKEGGDDVFAIAKGERICFGKA